MTKQNEMEILAATVAALGKDSYSATWLADQLPAIKQAIDSDLYPEMRAMSFSKLINAAFKMREDAKADAEKIIANAKAEALEIAGRALKREWEIKHRALKEMTAFCNQ
jgi:hypothetical protein